MNMKKTPSKPETGVEVVSIRAARPSKRAPDHKAAQELVTAARRPRALRTPITEGFWILGRIAILFYEAMPGFPDTTFGEKILRHLIEEPGYSAGDRIRQECEEFVALEPVQEESTMRSVQEVLIRYHIASAYAIDAIKACREGQILQGWALIADAQYWHGVIVHHVARLGDGGGSSLRENARRAARASHAVDYAMRAEVNAWCAAHLAKYASMDKAASAVAGTVVPRAWTTVRQWIGDWRQANPKQNA